jgi:hypothetical protein
MTIRKTLRKKDSSTVTTLASCMVAYVSFHGWSLLFVCRDQHVDQLLPRTPK